MRDQHCLLPRPAQNEIVAVAILASPMVVRYQRAIESGKGDDRRASGLESSGLVPLP